MKNMIFFKLLFCVGICSAQSIEKNLIASAGGTLTTSAMLLDYSIGEPLVAKIENGTTIDQGFLALVSEENTLSNLDLDFSEDVILYPNPVSDFVNIELGGNDSEYILKIFSIEGKLVKQISKLQDSSRIDLQELKTGIYIVQIYAKENGKNKTFKIQKN